jgi:hypothetical protein
MEDKSGQIKVFDNSHYPGQGKELNVFSGHIEILFPNGKYLDISLTFKKDNTISISANNRIVVRPNAANSIDIEAA